MRRIRVVLLFTAFAMLQVFAALPAGNSGEALDGWWAEGGERVWLENGRLNVEADSEKASAATVWRREPNPGDFVLEFDAHVVSSSTDVNNINLFFSYSDPSGQALEKTRHTRDSGSYALYHKLNGYIITFVNDPAGAGKARIRIRRNPGFHLLAETFAYHCRQGITYHMQVIKRGGDIRFSVDGKEVLRAVDPNPLGGGQLGLRTFRTWLWWENIKLKSAKPE